MDQLSMPYRIAVAGLLVFAMAWFAVLKPKADDGAAPSPVTTSQAPGTAGLGRAVDSAQGAVAASQGSAAQAQAAAGQATGGTAAPAATTPAPTAAAPKAAKAAKAARRGATATDSSAPVLAALDRGKVAVVLFSAKDATDDAHVRAVLRKVNRHGGKVAVYSASIEAVGRYAAITRGVEVMQGPTLLVIGKDHKARTIVGFTEVAEVQQLIDDVGRFRA